MRRDDGERELDAQALTEAGHILAHLRGRVTARLDDKAERRGLRSIFRRWRPAADHFGGETVAETP